MGPTNPAFSRNSKPPPLGGGVFTAFSLRNVISIEHEKLEIDGQKRKIFQQPFTCAIPSVFGSKAAGGNRNVTRCCNATIFSARAKQAKVANPSESRQSMRPQTHYRAYAFDSVHCAQWSAHD
jgi:hypothetical protein